METDWTVQTGALGDTRDRLIELDGLANRFGQSLSRAFASGVASGRSFDSILQVVGQKFVELSLRMALQPAMNLFSGAFGQMMQGIGGMFGGGMGGGVPITPFADGGVIASPGYFPLGRGVGLAGEAGPEAILPLARGNDGRLGVRAGGAASSPVYVTIQASDVDSFSRSEAQVSASIARAVARGRRSL